MVTSVIITDEAAVTAIGGLNSAALGFGSNGDVKNITIDANASVIAIGGKNGAGIGSGADSTYMPKIMIKGKASVIAQGGNYGAGIGYGGKFIEDVFISDGYVDITDKAVVNAAGGMYAAGIGGGKYSAGITLNVSGDAVVSGGGSVPIAPTDPKEIVDAAYALEKGKALPYSATLTGVITKVDTPYSEQYKNITVTIVIEGREDKPIMCFRLKGEGADALKEGDVITVTGLIKNYNGTIEFDSGCKLDAVVPATGDNSSILLMAVLMTLSATAFAAVHFCQKRYN
jgi:hypothetical protein